MLKATGAVGVTAAPVYYDGQVVLEHDLSPHTTARLAFIGSDDRLALEFSSPQGSDPLTGFGSSTRFWRLQARTDTHLSGRARWITTLAFGLDHQKLDLGDKFLDIAQHPLSLRSDLRVRLSRAVTAIAGFDGTATNYSVSAKAGPPPRDGQAQGPFFAIPTSLISSGGSVTRLSAYAMLEVTPLRGLKLLPSVRADYSGELAELTASPRLTARADVRPSYPRTTLKAGVGLFYQPPQAAESIPPFGSKALGSNRALHTSLGIEQELSRQIEVSVEGFYKKLDHLVEQRPAATTTQFGVDYVNTGSGRAYGGEILLRYKPDSRFFGWVAYTLSRSERRPTDADSYRVFEFDQTHILTVLGSYRIGAGWEVGARFRYVTGNPYTPVVAGILDADAGAYSPINGALYSARSPAFHRLDLRVEKTWTFTSWKLSAYLDLQNTYNYRTPEGRTYNFNYTRSDVVAGLPILPVLGLRGEL